ncbi:MAG: PD-(D/E)XK nuclease family protein [Cyanobacteria bacterium]|nr:PD-(D/E)XK nuclease family protein [Cyanobacteriota bacterium]MDW8200452.1 PD-(D/E)XK nuclease family protein [Cyanobacteriota bacterium SKYGB_h_bin112]
MIYLSQGYLNLLSLCPRKFQYSYLEHLEAPVSPDQQARIAWGNQFHLLMQQQELGLSIAPLLTEYPQLQTAINTVLHHIRDVSDDPTTTLSTRDAEHCRTLLTSIAGYDYVFTVIYDLVILQPHHAYILDWKTYPQPQQADRLANNWQTRLYPYVLAETTAYAPEQITMTYWFVSSAQNAQPTSLTFPYSTTQHHQTRQTLTELLTQLTAWLQQFQHGIELPQVPESFGLCSSCPYAIRCQRHLSQQAAIPENWLAQVLQEDNTTEA